MNMVVVWALAILVFGILEAITAQLVSIWFVLGSIGALIATWCGGELWVQILVFIAVSIVALIVTKPLVKKYIRPKMQKTNADRCIGSEGLVTEEINNLAATGQVKVNGNVWTARSTENEIIPEGTVITVDSIEGVKLLVTSAKTTVTADKK